MMVPVNSLSRRRRHSRGKRALLQLLVCVTTVHEAGGRTGITDLDIT
jgi:hypothetical protein